MQPKQRDELNHIVIQPYDGRTQDKIHAFILNIQNNEFKVSVTLQDQPDLENISEFFQNGLGNFWVVLDGSEVIGTIGLKDIGDKQVALRKMFVHADYRGAGVAQKLLDTVLAWCKTHHITDIYLGTVAILHAAHRFYEKSGFRKIEKTELPPSFPIMYVDTFFYRYQLA